MASLPLADQALHVMAKPIGPICNLDCTYCYYLHKEDLYPKTKQWKMDDATLEAYIRGIIASQPPEAETIPFAWQGGEPTLLGIEFFERAVEIQNKLAPPDIIITNTLQTNGTLLDEAWCQFFKANEFLLGLSIDGPPDLHDHYRVDKKGEPSFEAVSIALDLLIEHEIDFNALVTVHRHNQNSGRKIYTYLRKRGVRFMQFIPIVEKRGEGEHPEPEAAPDAQFPHRHLASSRSVDAFAFGRFLLEVFDEWIQRDVGTMYVQIFDEAFAAWIGQEPSLCLFRSECGRALALEHNGDVYSCDHFVDPDHRLGNVNDTPLNTLALLDQQKTFASDKDTTLPEYCKQCEVRFVCNGECPKNRFIDTPDGESGLNYLCEGYRLFFNQVAPAMRRMAELMAGGLPPAQIMDEIKASQQQDTEPNASTQHPPGRNDPCPCGSGQKFKKCCGRS